MTHGPVDPSAILSTWSQEAAQDLEAGRTPLIVLGAGSLGLDTLPGLLALSALDEEHTGLAHPVVLAGGDGQVWLLALTQRPRRRRPQAGGEAARRVQAIQAHTPAALFTGPDAGTHVAALNLAAQSLTPSPVVRPNPSGQALGESVPPGLAWAIFPTRSAGAMNVWAWLPWESVEPSSASRPTAPATASATASATDPIPSPIAAWTAYAGLFLALGLLLAGLIL